MINRSQLNKVKSVTQEVKDKKDSKSIEIIFAHNGITEDGRNVDDIKTRNSDGLIEFIIVDFV